MGWRGARTPSLATALLVASFHFLGAHAGNTTCASNQLSWYTDVVGETPCETYQRLRQICNNDYQVPSFRPTTPGDQCDDQVSACCCNTVAFQLSMLCMNCQQDKVDGDQIGIDAGIGAYTLYKNNCGAGTNNSLPTNVQSAVCNVDIRLDNFVYGGWSDGSWFYVWTKENAELQHAVNNNNTFTHCADQISPSATATPSSSSGVTSGAATTGTLRTSPSSAATASQTAQSDTLGKDSGSSHTASIVGGVVGGIGGLAVIIAGVLFWRCRRHRSVGTPATQDIPYTYVQNNGTPEMSAVQPLSPNRGYSGPESPSDGMQSSVYPQSTTSPSAWSRSAPSFDPTSMIPGNSIDRHADGGPVVQLVRSSSGRLPPAYRSWEQSVSNAPSHTRSPSGSVSGSASQVSSPQTASAVGSATQMPLAPQRRMSNKETREAYRP